jgi:hypothetical protein
LRNAQEIYEEFKTLKSYNINVNEVIDENNNIVSTFKKVVTDVGSKREKSVIVVFGTFFIMSDII